jgi:hypothetical protein
VTTAPVYSLEQDQLHDYVEFQIDRLIDWIAD